MCPKCSRKAAYETNGFVPWSKGLTKHTDERVAATAAHVHEYYTKHKHPNTGKTKENDRTVRAKAIKIKTSLKKFYEKNNGWSLGLTKETSDIIAKRGKKISESLKGRIPGEETLEKMRKAKLLSHDIVQQRLRERGIELTTQYIDTITKAQLRCLKCSTTFERHVGAVFNNNARCPNCFPPWDIKTSKWQNEIFMYVKDLAADAVLNDRQALDGKELDIYVPSQNFAIECNGLFWHSDFTGRFASSHAEDKRLLAQKAGITLLTIFDDEWRERKQIVKSMIAHRLGKSSTIGARKLLLQRCKPSEVAKNIENWHLEGRVNASYALRLVTDQNKTMGACSLRWARGTNKTTLEIARIAFMPGIHVQGGMGRFVNEAKRWAAKLGATTLLSYSDNRLGNGTGYLKAGMQLDSTTVLRFWWTDFNQRFNRFRYRADAQRNLTEREVAQEANVVRIYGCSNLKWILDINVH